jgi:uncharacterized protein YbcV (DUF1398 family)
MSIAISNLQTALHRAMSKRPKIGGFPHLAETLRSAGVVRNIWSLPSCQSLYLTKDGPVMHQGIPLVTGVVDVPKFDETALISALRRDQAGNSAFTDFLAASWQAGVVRYEVDFARRHVIYYGSNDESYVEEYPEVTLC